MYFEKKEVKAIKKLESAYDMQQLLVVNALKKPEKQRKRSKAVSSQERTSSRVAVAADRNKRLRKGTKK